MSHIEKHTYCLNCEEPYLEGQDLTTEFHCSNCGQTNRESTLSVIKLLKDAVANILNLDGRFFLTLRDIYSPSKLTATYIGGKRKHYVNPARLFIFSLIVLLSLSIPHSNSKELQFEVDSVYDRANSSNLLDQYNTIIDTLEVEIDSGATQLIKERLFKNVNETATDTIGLGTMNIFGIDASIQKYGISSFDAVNLDTDQIFTKYKIEGFWNQLNVGQYIRIITDPSGSLIYALKNITWAIFITVFLIAFVMKLLYIRKNYYLVEHAVLVLNSHSLIFIIISLILLLNLTILRFFDNGYDDESSISGLLTALSILVFPIIQFLSLKRYYKQGIIKTLIKQSIINSAYFVFFTLSVLIVAIISVILY